MTNKDHVRKAHSEEYFGEYRDFWWNSDFLDMMGKRLGFDQIKTVLDVGCGVGHWGQILSSALPDSAQVIGVDLEDGSLSEAARRAKVQGLENRYSYRRGDVLALPFADDTFDMVTCQTLLIHLKNPVEGLCEMLRVLRPGGLLLVAEPNNFSNNAVSNSLTDKLSVDEYLERLKFSLLIERGKKVLGLGFNSEGDLIPGHLTKLGAKNINVYLSDKALPFFAPYTRADQVANIKQMKEWAQREFAGWDKEEMKSYFLAGGGEPQRFEDLWMQSLKDAREAIIAIDQGQYYTAGGAITYLISATK